LRHARTGQKTINRLEEGPDAPLMPLEQSPPIRTLTGSSGGIEVAFGSVTSSGEGVCVVFEHGCQVDLARQMRKISQGRQEGHHPSSGRSGTQSHAAAQFDFECD
jgi:hypothetical protein